MPGTPEIHEAFESRRISVGAEPGVQLKYILRHVDAEAAALDLLLTTSPTTFDPWGSGLLFLPRTNLSIERIGGQDFVGHVHYGPRSATGARVVSFDTTGGTQHITHALATAAYAKPGATAPDYQGAIGVGEHGVAGVDIVVPVFAFVVARYKPAAEITQTYLGHLYALTGTLNHTDFDVDVNGQNLRFAAGECLFKGAVARQRDLDDWEIQFHFAASPNKTGLQVGEITGIAKKGWDYLWTRFAKAIDDDAKVLADRPQAVYVATVLEEADFTLLAV